MGPLGAFFRAKLRMARHSVASVRRESKLKVAVVSIATVLLWVGAYGAFHAGFHWLQHIDVGVSNDIMNIGEIVMLRLLSVFALALFLMLIFSNILISFSTLYRAQETSYLLQTPLSHRELFLGRFAECVVFSSWASAFLGSPLILAYGRITGAPLAFYFAALAVYIPFVTVPAALGAIFTISLVRVYPRLPRGALAVAAALLAAGLAFYLRDTFNTARMAEDTYFQSKALSAFGAISTQTQSPWLPSHWAAQSLILVSRGQYADGLFYILLLLSNALLIVWLASELAQRMYYPGWASLAGRERKRLRWFTFGVLGHTERLMAWAPQPARALIVKDIKLFWREPAQWLQFIIFFGIMAVYIAGLRNQEVPGAPYYRSWIACMNIGACTLILATLTSRFVFPLVSLEGRRFWVLGLAPITFRQVVRQKFWLSVATTSAFTIGLIVLSCIRLGVEPLVFFLAVYSIIITNFALSGLAVGLGSLFPNFQEDNPARIVSGMGGTLNFLLSMGYIALVVGAQTVIIQWRVLERFTHPGSFRWALTGVLVFITVLSAVCAIAPLRLGLMHLDRAEF